MRKLTVLILALSLLAVACGGDSGETTTTTAAQTTTTAAAAAEEPAATTTAAPSPVDDLPELTVNVGHSGAPDGFADVASVRFKQLVEERSQGKITVEVFPSGQLGGERELVEGAQIGSVDMAVVLAGILESFVPDFGVLNLPYLFDNRDHVFSTLDGEVGEGLLGLLDDVQLKGYAFGEFGFRSMMTAPRPINTPADLDGIKIRVPESDLYIETMSRLGATPTPIPGPEIFTSLQNGVVEAPTVADRDAALLMVGSQDLWNRAGQTGRPRGHRRRRRFAELRNQGWSITEVDKAPFRQAVAPIYDANPDLEPRRAPTWTRCRS